MGEYCSEKDIHFMSLALELADQKKGSTFPNPAVGAVIVKNGKIVGKGATSHYGGPHAERNALAEAKGRAAGATLYVTLEPCCHFGKTSPCTDAIISSGIKQAFVSVKDPNALVSGKGIRLMRKNGIEVFIGLCKEKASRINEDFFFWITRNRPWVSVKLAMTLDGRIAGANGISKWITSLDARKYAHGLRARHAAVGIGSTTLIKDDPRLTVRHGMRGNPVRFVFSSKDFPPTGSYFVANAGIRSRSVWVASGAGRHSKQVLSNGLEIWRTGTKDKNKSLHSFLHMAYEEGISSILIEGGSGLASSFVENRLANRLYLFYGNKIIGSGLTGLNFSKSLPLDGCMMLERMELVRFSRDFMVTGLPVWS